MKYRRAKTPGGTYFFTVVTNGRQKIFSDPQNIDILRASFRYVIRAHPFKVNACIILPDHLHAIWTLPETDADFPTRWRLIKSYFSRNWQSKDTGQISPSRHKKHEQGVWQRRYWEHQIRDEVDLKNHVEYIHYNVVKHGLARSPADWMYSSFQWYVKRGLYSIDWAASEDFKVPPGIGME